MTTKGAAVWRYYMCLDGDNRPKTGDLDNHTIYWTADGTTAEATNNQGGAEHHVEIGNGMYAILLTSAETNCDAGNLSGGSATEGAIIVPAAGYSPETSVAAGVGSKIVEIICQVGGVEQIGVKVQVSSDADGNERVAGPLWSNALGVAGPFMLDPGSYYVWRYLANANLANPQIITVDE